MSNRPLKTAKVYRGGKTARSLTLETKSVKITEDKDGVRFDFSISSKGGGKTEIAFSFGAEDFTDVLETLACHDRRAAMVAMSSVLNAEITKQIEHDQALKREITDSLITKARENFWLARGSEKQIAKIVFDELPRVVSALDA